jgi:hypothetical protein
MKNFHLAIHLVLPLPWQANACSGSAPEDHGVTHESRLPPSPGDGRMKAAARLASPVNPQ